MARLERIRNLAAVATLAFTGAACGGTTVNNYYEGGSPTPSAAAGQSSSPEVTPTPLETIAINPAYNDHELKPGESIVVNGHALVQGDVIVDGKTLYDNRQETGLIVEIDGGTHTIVAPFGADVQEFGSNVDQATFEDTEGTDLELMKENGCGLSTGCDSVKVVKIGE